MTDGNVSFAKAEYNLNEDIQAVFSWQEAVYNPLYEAFCLCFIYDPNGNIVKEYKDGGSTDAKTLVTTGNILGTYRARIRVWAGASWIDKSVYTNVVEVEPEPEPPPEPPPEETYDLTFYTTPGVCTIHIFGGETKISNDEGYRKFYGLPKGDYVYEVMKEGYISVTDGISIFGDRTVNVTLDKAAPPTETFSLTVKTVVPDAYVTLDGIGLQNSGTAASTTFYGLLPGDYEGEVVKTDHDTRRFFVTITGNTTITVDISGAPDFWTDPIGWIQYFVITTMDTLLGWTGGSFVNLLHQVKAFFDNSWTQIAAFFSDVTGNIVKAVQDNLGVIIDWVSSNLTAFADWISTISAEALENLKTFLGDVGDFVGTAFTGFVDWLSTLTGTVADFIGTKIGEFVDWSADQLTSIWEGIQSWVIDLITELISSVNAGFDQGIEDQKNKRNEEEL